MDSSHIVLRPDLHNTIDKLNRTGSLNLKIWIIIWIFCWHKGTKSHLHCMPLWKCTVHKQWCDVCMCVWVNMGACFHMQKWSDFCILFLHLFVCVRMCAWKREYGGGRDHIVTDTKEFEFCLNLAKSPWVLLYFFCKQNLLVDRNNEIHICCLFAILLLMRDYRFIQYTNIFDVFCDWAVFYNIEHLKWMMYAQDI